MAVATLAALFQGHVFGLASRSTPYDGCRVASFLRSNRDSLSQAAVYHGLPSVAVAGVIAAEWIVNRNFVDSLQDQWLLTRLKIHDDMWWERWAEESAQAADHARSTRLMANKWPVSLVASGYVMSFGPAQIQPRTIILACRRFSSEEPICRKGVKNLMTTLLSDEASVRLVAVILHYEAEIWAAHTKHNAMNDVGMLATLYSAGAEYRIAIINDVNRKALNRFGLWVESHRTVIESLLTAHTPSTFSSPFECSTHGVIH
jgi:hypothetical protein